MARKPNDDEDKVEQEAPIGLLPGGTLNVVNEDDPPFEPMIIPAPKTKEEVR